MRAPFKLSLTSAGAGVLKLGWEKIEMTTITVGQGQQYETISQAVAASKDGDIVQVQAGTYTDDFATINTDIKLEGVGGMVKMVASGDIPNGKGILVTNGDVTISNFEFSGAQVSDGNGAGVRYEDGNLTVENSYFHDNQNGILANASDTGTITIKGSEFDHNGSGDGYTHNLYVNDVAKLSISDSYFHDAVQGHEIKSRAEVTEISDSRIFDNDGTASYSVDLPNGGQATLTNNVIQQGANSANPNIIAYGAEGSLHDNSSLTVTGNTIINDMDGRGAVLLNASNTEGTFEGNQVYGANEVISGSGVNESGTTELASAPSLDSSHPWSSSESASTDPAASGDTSTSTGTDVSAGGDASDDLSSTDPSASNDGGAAAPGAEAPSDAAGSGHAGSASDGTDASVDPGSSTGAHDTAHASDPTGAGDTGAIAGGDASDDLSSTGGAGSADAGSDASVDPSGSTSSDDTADASDPGTGSDGSADDGSQAHASCGGRHEYLTGVDGDDNLHFGRGHSAQTGPDGVFEGGAHDRAGGVSDLAHSLTGGEHAQLGLALGGADAASTDPASLSDTSASAGGCDAQHLAGQSWQHGSSDFLMG